jgi:hypothetical protein
VGAAGALGPLPATLPAGETERGFWTASADAPPEISPFATPAQVSFPVPLSVALTEFKVHYIGPTLRAELETNPVKTVGGCKSSTAETIHPLEKPVAESNNLCVYAGVEEGEDDRFIAIVNTLDAPGASRTGATLLFEVEKIEVPPEHVRIQASGTWAVKG